MVNKICPDETCEFKGEKICPFPNLLNRGKCVYYVPSPCEKCSLKGKPYTRFGTPESGVMVVGGSNYDSPSESIAGAINKMSQETGLLISYYYTTAVKCLSEKKPSMALIKRCNSYLKEEIEIIKPKYILVVGEVAFKALLWDFDLITKRKPEIDACAGSHIDKDGIIYFVIHDLESIRKSGAKQDATVEYIRDFLRLINGRKTIRPVSYKEVENEKELIYISEEAERTSRVVVDIETHLSTPFLPESEILTVSFTVKEGESFCVPLSWKKGSYFKKWDFSPKINTFLALTYMSKLLKNSNITKIFHNASFDIMWLEHMFGVEVKNFDDTMIMKFLMNQNEQDRKGLKYLTKKHLDMGYYEYNIKQYVGDDEPYSNIPPHILMHYNNADTDATLRLWNIFKRDMKGLQLEDIHYNFMIPKLRGIINLQKTGIALNVNKCIEMKTEYESKLVELFSNLKALSQVANFERKTGLEFMPSSDKHKFAMVYGGEITTEREKPRKINPKTGKKIGKKEYEKVFYNGFDLELITVPAKNTITGKKGQRKSFGKKAIQKYLKGVYKDIEYLDPINTFNLELLPNDTDIMKFIKLVSEISSIQTQLSNHIEPFLNVWSKTVDKCVHTSYDFTGTATGRLSCIAKGAWVDVYLPYTDSAMNYKGVPIENIKIGDLVYTSDNKQNLCIKKVIWAGFTGQRECVKIHWIGNGKRNKGSLVLTYDHKVRLLNGRWKEARELIKNDKILAFSKSSYSKFRCVSKIEDYGISEVYNLEVEGTHRYFANELCVKNSRAPNLQNLKRDGFVKEAFISRWGDKGILLEADYKQLELFVMAIVSQDPKFVHAFTHSIDLHLKTAANIVFRCVEDAVTKQMRTMAKTVNFGIIYGKTAYTLKDDLNVSEEEAERILRGYFEEYSGVRAYCDWVKNQARTHGYVTTITGRRRYFDYSDPNGADRQAVNTMIQSPASDVCVTAVNLLQEYFRKVADGIYEKNKEKSQFNVLRISEGNDVKREPIAVVCGTVHDSIIIDCKRKHINEIVSATQLITENTGLSFLTIPLKVDIKYGSNLRDMVEWDGEEIYYDSGRKHIKQK